MGFIVGGFLLKAIRCLFWSGCGQPIVFMQFNNCFSILTRSDLNRIRKETIKKRLV